MYHNSLHSQSCPRIIFNEIYYTQEGFPAIVARIIVNVSFRDNSCFGTSQKSKNVCFTFSFLNNIDERMTSSGNQETYGEE